LPVGKAGLISHPVPILLPAKSIFQVSSECLTEDTICHFLPTAGFYRWKYGRNYPHMAENASFYRNSNQLH
jgi:hypothetical protein